MQHQGEPQGIVGVAPFGEWIHFCLPKPGPDLLHHFRVKPPLVWQGAAGAGGLSVIDNELQLALLTVEHRVKVLKVVPPLLPFHLG